ncbi:MAG TPA: hypothetical protein VKF40_20395 [Burkholderiales bacterium]|nr:hypothetical protein [Burkholderiales bacterium]
MKALLVACALAVTLGTGSQGAAQSYPPDASTIPTVMLNGSPPSRQPAPRPANQQSAWNTVLAGHSDLQGRSAYQPIIINENGRHIAYVGHHTGKMPNPLTGAVEGNGTSIVDVTNPAKPRYLAHIPGPAEGGDEAGGAQMVRVCSGDVLPKGVKGKWYLLRALGSTAHEIYDVTDKAHPVLLTTVVDGLTGTHKSWWECDTGIAYLVGNNSAEGWRGNHMKIFDLSDPAKPVYIRDFGLLGQQPDAKSFIGTRAGVNIHGPISAGVAKNRVYAAYGTGANGVIQILDRKKLLTEFTNALKPTAEEMLAPQVGYIVMSPDQGAHTTLPLYGVPIPGFQGHTVLQKRDLMIVASEQGRGEHCRPGPGGNRPAPHLGFLLDITNEATPWPLATFHVPEQPGDFCGRGGRFGNHASHESFYPPYYGKLAVFSWFNAGTRIFDIRNPFAVEEVAYFIPAPNKYTMAFCSDGVSHPDGDPKIIPACVKVIQTNNVEVDDRGLIYSADRAGTGLHIIRLTGRAARVAAQ